MIAAAPPNEEAYWETENRSDVRHEYVNGMIVAMAGATPRHNILVANMASGMNARLGGKCRAVTSDQRLHIPATGIYTYPDVVLICGEWKLHAKDRATVLNPSLLVEVLSPATEAYDRGAKFRHYQHISTLMDYVLVAQDERLVEHFRRSETGEWIYRAYEGEDKVLWIEDLGLSLPLRDIYEGVELVPGGGDMDIQKAE